MQNEKKDINLEEDLDIDEQAIWEEFKKNKGNGIADTIEENLKNHRLVGACFDDKTLIFLAPYMANFSLTHIDFSICNAITHKGFSELANLSIEELKSLDLSYTIIQAKHLPTLNNLLLLSADLEELNLKNTKIMSSYYETETIPKFFQNLEHCFSLKYLNLSSDNENFSKIVLQNVQLLATSLPEMSVKTLILGDSSLLPNQAIEILKILELGFLRNFTITTFEMPHWINLENSGNQICEAIKKYLLRNCERNNASLNLEQKLDKVQYKSSLQVQDKNGWTALHYAASRGDDAFCLALLKAGADPYAQNFTHNHFPLEYAMAYCKKEEGELSSSFRSSFINPLFRSLILFPSLHMQKDLLDIISSYVFLEKEYWPSLMSLKKIKNLKNIFKKLKLNSLKQKVLKLDSNDLLMEKIFPNNEGATKCFEFLLRCFLNGQSVEFKRDENKNLLAFVEEKPYNITECLLNYPDIESITLSDADLKKCYDLVDLAIKQQYPDIYTDVFDYDFERAEKKYGIDSKILYPAQKIVLRLYTTFEFGLNINYFFRTYGMASNLDHITIFIVAAKLIVDGLSKLPYREEDREVVRFIEMPEKDDVGQALALKEREQEMMEAYLAMKEALEKKDSRLIKKAIICEETLLSTMRIQASEARYVDSHSVRCIVNDRLGKSIIAYSKYKIEKEVLLPFYTKMMVSAVDKDHAGRQFFLYEPLTPSISQTLFPVPSTQMEIVTPKNATLNDSILT